MFVNDGLIIYLIDEVHKLCKVYLESPICFNWRGEFDLKFSDVFPHRNVIEIHQSLMVGRHIHLYTSK